MALNVLDAQWNSKTVEIDAETFDGICEGFSNWLANKKKVDARRTFEVRFEKIVTYPAEHPALLVTYKTLPHGDFSSEVLHLDECGASALVLPRLTRERLLAFPPHHEAR